jgi:hypothetical protein
MSHKPLMEAKDKRSYNEIRDLFVEHTGKDPPEAMVRATMSESNPMQLEDRKALATVWLEKYIDSYADISPNSDRKRLNVNFKNEIYDQYKNSYDIKKTAK